MKDDKDSSRDINDENSLFEFFSRFVWALFAASFALLLVYGIFRTPYFLMPLDRPEILKDHPAILLAITVGVSIASILVGLVRSVDGRLTFRFLGLEVQGAAATAFLWHVTFLLMVASVRILW
jgi:hypothetical protein